MLRRGQRLIPAIAVGAVMVAGVTVPMPVLADAPTGATSITVFLQAPDPAGLDRLAGVQGLTRSQRISEVSRLVPSEATHARVRQVLHAEGFTVTGETSWSISADGPAAQAANLFGTRPVLGRHPDASRYAAATGALPRLPSRLGDVVTAVYPTTDGPAAFRHASTSSLDGQDFRNADTPANVAPSHGQRDVGATIATLQLADFYGAAADTSKSATAADLTSYAKEHALPDPVASGHYRAIKVDGGPRVRDDQSDGDVEVDLDQESILSTAPTANQHAYFAPNTMSGFDDVFAHVYDDAVGNSHATAADRHIVAMSASWGQCESETSPDEIATLEPILKSLLAAGVTLFASSGDDGIYDCGFGPEDHQADVDYPGSSPSVVSVGGSRLSAAVSAPNTGTNWIEKAWSCGNPTACQAADGTGGSGGGASGSAASGGSFPGFAAPAYQKVAIDDRPFKGATKRLVPDIAADADQASGFVMYTSNPDAMPGPGNHDARMGGTSLASPISAAQLTNALADVGRTTGIGSIHGALYSAYAQTRSLPKTSPKRPFRDITAGTNGAAADRSTDPKTTAQAGYDTVSGLGGVLWSALVPYLLDQHKPSSTVSFSEPALRTRDWRRTVATWRISRSGDPELLGTTTVRITRSGSSASIYAAATLPASSSRTFVATPGATYHVTVVGQDLGGHRSAPASATIQVPIDDSWFQVSPGWHRYSGLSDIGGSHLVSTTKSAHATVSRSGRVYRLVVRVGPDRGALGVYLHGRRVATVNLRSAKIGRERKTIYSARTRAQRSFTFRPLSARRIDIDGLYVA